MDVAFWNAIANDPEVRSWIGGTGDVDTSSIVLNPNNFCLRAPYGGFMCINHGGGSYSVHSLFLPEGRDGTVEAMRSGCDFMFTRTDCTLLWTQLPDANRPAQNLGKACGFSDWFRRENDPLMGPSMMGRLGIDAWIMGPNADYLGVAGAEFHEMLEDAKATAKSALDIHPDDPAHDRYVGAASLMCARGQAPKGVTVYNAWAAAAGYAHITLVSANPPVVDVLDGVVGLGANGSMEVLLCR
jgi:hypothetical protein